MHQCETCKNASVTLSLSGHHITCDIDRRDYSFAKLYECETYEPNESVKRPEVKLYLCPKFDICIMDCHHKKPHETDKWCNPESSVNKENLGQDCECPKCVEEIKADITFLPEDFEL